MNTFNLKEKNLNKTLQLSDDVYFENLLHTLHGICEYRLPTVLKAMIRWYEKQTDTQLDESRFFSRRKAFFLVSSFLLSLTF